MEGSSPGGGGKKGFLVIVGAVLGIFILLLLGVFFVHGKSAVSNKRNFLASFSSLLVNFFSGEEPIAEINLTESEGTAFKPCSYTSNGLSVSGQVIFNEIAWMGTKDDYNAEWIELKNISSLDADVSFWRILSDNEKIKIVIPKDVKIPAGDVYVLSRTGSIKGNQNYEGALVNTGMGLKLFSSSCLLADEIIPGKWPAGDNTTKRTMERAPDFSWRTSGVSDGTPGGENSSGAANAVSQKSAVNVSRSSEESGTSSYSQPKNETVLVYPSILINEVYVGSEGMNSDEYIEIFNPYNESVPLGGWSIKKKSSTGVVGSLVSSTRLEGRFVPANGFFLLRNEASASSVSADAVWAKSNTLAYSENSVLLVNPKGEIIHEVHWTEIPKGSSFSRDAEGNYGVSGKSPKQPNF